ncbi:Scr1 family TA system antitoxin-like transcriptional regulator [Streptomyces xanthochromogenes]|uniref:Scr1 family TA system antitoxin-like transcriptional regulator n=1 Tax=Streptomyces xanthochromogenes TaxID=67384 RepID=UPI003F4D4CED
MRARRLHGPTRDAGQQEVECFTGAGNPSTGPRCDHRSGGKLTPTSCATRTAIGNAPELDVVHVDIIGGGLFMEKPAELERYKLAFQYLSAQALDIEASAALLDRARREL